MAERLITETKTIFPIEVNYSKSLDEMISEANFDYLNSQITAEHFPIQGNDIQLVNLRLVKIENPSSTATVLNLIKNLNLTPAKIEQLVAFATQYPDFQKTGYPIVALGTQWQRSENEIVVPVLRGGENDRNMHLLRTANRWNPSEIFAAIQNND